MSSEVELVSYFKDRKERTTESRYYLRHHNGKTVLEQGLVITSDQFGSFKASPVITDFPNEITTEKAAALKLADWLKRMGEAIGEHWKEGGDGKDTSEAL